MTEIMDNGGPVDTLSWRRAEVENEKKRAVIDRLLALKESRNGLLVTEDYEIAGAWVGRTARTVQTWMHDELQRLGVSRRARHRAKPELTPQMVGVYYAHGGSIRRSHQDMVGHGLFAASESTWARMIHTMPEGMRRFPFEGHGALVNGGLYRLWTAPHPNDVQMLDSHRVDQPCLYKGDVIYPWLTTTQDDHSRLITGMVISVDEPTAKDVAATLALSWRVRTAPDGTRYGGTPQMLIVDNATINTARQIVFGAAEMAVKIYQCAPYAPWQKAKLERLFRIVEEEAFFDLSGHSRAEVTHADKTPVWTPSMLPTFDHVVARTYEFMDRYNYQRVHSALGCTPIEAWGAHDIELVEPHRALIAKAFLDPARQTHYKVHKYGVHVNAQKYIGECLSLLVGKTVRIRCLPDDPTIVEVFSPDDHDYLGTAWHHALITPEVADRIQNARDAVTAHTYDFLDTALAVRGEHTLLEMDGDRKSFAKIITDRVAMTPALPPAGPLKATSSVTGMPGADIADLFDPNTTTTEEQDT